MTTDAFLKKFEMLAETPHAVNRLRELALGLAFSGGLSGARRDPGGIPEGWQIRTIESVAISIGPGFACSKSKQVEDGHVHLRTHNISTLGTLNFDLLIRIDPTMVDPQKSSIHKGDILFNNTNSQELVGKTALVDQDYDYGFSNHITRIRLGKDAFPGYLAYYLTFLRNRGHFARLCTRWINQAAINTDTLKEQTVPFPSLAEQKRIVAKVDELMALCDRLEALQAERDTTHVALARASLARFANAPTPANLEFLFHDSYAIDPADLRMTILAAAVRGRLLPQDPHDQTAAHELAACRTKLKLADWIPLEDDAANTPFGIPDNWCWVMVDAVANSRLGKMLDVEKNRGESHPYLRNTNVHWFRFELDNIKTMLFDRSEVDDFQLHRGDVLICEGGHGIARAAVWNNDLPGMTFQKALHRVRCFPCLNPHFFTFCLRVFESEGVLQRYYTGAGIPHFTGRSLAKVLFPLPPLAEQYRIVTKVNELMALVDQLEAHLSAANDTGEHLMEAVVAELTQQI